MEKDTMIGFSSKLFLRIISRSKEIYLLKIVSLSIAFAASTLVILFAWSEFTFDRFHKNAGTVFRVLRRNTNEPHLGNRLSNKIPTELYQKLSRESKDSLVVSRVNIMNGITIISKQKSIQTKIHAADISITDIFSFNIIDGSVGEFQKKQRILLSSSAALALFGEWKVSGKTLKFFSGGDTIQYTIAAVFQNFAKNSHEEFNLFMTFETPFVSALGFNAEETGIYGRAISGSVEHIESQLNAQLAKTSFQYILQPLSEIYFGPRVQGEDAKHGDYYSILILVSLTSLILLLALTSYVNLTTLTLPHRSKELAVKKLMGTNFFHLFFLFFKESVAIVLVSFLLGVFILLFTVDLVEPILSINVITLAHNGDIKLLLVIFGVLMILILSPLVLTIKFIRASPNRLLSTEQITFPRLKKIIAISQLGISIFLIVSSLVIRRQINYSLLKEPGRNYEQIVFLDFPKGLTMEGLARLRSGWRENNPSIVDVIALSHLPDKISSKEINSPFYAVVVDPNFQSFFGLNMIQGNWFRPNAADSIFVVNQYALPYLNQIDSKNILGVIDDMNSQYNQPQKPMKFKVSHETRYNYLCIRILEVDIRRTVRFLSETFDTPVHFLNNRFEEWLRYQDRLNTISALLAIISGLLSCCAIYGLSISLIRDTIKKIAVHKIYGASTVNITWLLARDFTRQVVVALLIFIPATYILTSEFLRTFVYATRFQWLDLVIPIAYCLFVVVILCSFQAISLSRRDLTSALKQ